MIYYNYLEKDIDFEYIYMLAPPPPQNPPFGLHQLE